MHRHFTALAALGFCTALTAQNDYALDKTAAGTLGGQLGLSVRSAPANAFMVVMLSRNGGPTALATFDATDPRSGQVGLELSALWFTMFTDGTGAANINLAMPVIPSIHGWALHWQTLTFPGTAHIVDKISNDVVTQFGTAGAPVTLPAVLATARAFPTALWNRSFNAGAGDVVLAGGGTGTLTSASGLSSSEIYDFRHMTVRAGPNLTGTRAVHTATELTDGRWLLTGGSDSSAAVLATCEIYDPVANTFTATASMSVPRAMHAAARLSDGRVMVAGGTNTLTTLLAAIAGVQSSVEIWNPTTGTWSAGPALSGPRLAPALTTLNTGRTMCSGGVQVGGFIFGIPTSASSVTTVQLYDVATNSWSAGASMAQGRAGHHYNQVTLNDGRVLMTGGVNVPNLAGAASATSINNAEYYTPSTNTWTAANMVSARSLHSASLLADGRVAVCGGAQGTLTAPVSIAGVEVFSPTTNTWSNAGPMNVARSAHGAAVLPDGLLVLFGGQGTAVTEASIETLHF